MTINGGSFESQGSGAMIIGTSEATASATINGGEFIASGQTGFSVYNYARVSFTSTDVKVKGVAAGLTVEGIHNGSSWFGLVTNINYQPSTVEIKGGTFTGTGGLGRGDGIWLDNKCVTMTITGGTIDGEGDNAADIYITNSTLSNSSGAEGSLNVLPGHSYYIDNDYYNGSYVKNISQ